jgi:predicted PurR-regulated permease PerM
MAMTPGPNELRDPFVRREVQRAAIWIAMVGGVALAWMLAQPLLLILAAIVFATMLDGGTRLLGRVLPLGRGWRLAIVLLGCLGFVYWLVVFSGNQLVSQAAQLQTVIVTQVERLLALADANGVSAMEFDVKQAIDYVLGSVGRVTAAVGTVIGGLTSLAMIFVLGIFLAIEPRLYERGFAWLLPTSERSHFFNIANAMGFTLRRLMAGRLLGMLVEGVATWILLAVYGVPMAALLGIITGILVFIPNVGAILSGVLMVLVGFSLGLEGGLYALFVYAVVQTVDGYIIVPMVAKRTVDLAPALVLGAQLLFGALFGIMGLALADPIVAMIKVLLEKNAERGAATDDAAEEAVARNAQSSAVPAAARVARRLRRET